MHGYLSLDIICSEKRIVFRERSSRKTVSFVYSLTPFDKKAAKNLLELANPTRNTRKFAIKLMAATSGNISPAGYYLSRSKRKSYNVSALCG